MTEGDNWVLWVFRRNSREENRSFLPIRLTDSVKNSYNNKNTQCFFNDRLNGSSVGVESIGTGGGVQVRNQ